MDTNKLMQDWKTDPHLQGFAFRDVEDLSKHLRELHVFLLSPEGGLAGYLYQEQTRRVRELKKV